MEDPIITADDFGVSGEVNQAIVEALECGLTTSPSLVTNAGSFEQACSIAHEQSLTDRLGLHLVLTEGVPLTEPSAPAGASATTMASSDTGEARTMQSASHRSRERPSSPRCGLRCAAVLSTAYVRLTSTRITTFTISLRSAGSSWPLRRSSRSDGSVWLTTVAHALEWRTACTSTWVNRGIRGAGLAETRWFGSADDYIALRAKARTERAGELRVQHPSSYSRGRGRRRRSSRSTTRPSPARH